MNNYRLYLSSTSILENKLKDAFQNLNIEPIFENKILDFLLLLKKKSLVTYQHCIRVGLLCESIGNFLKTDSRALFYAGLLHDLGKYKIPSHLLNKTSNWSEEDKHIMKSHVLDGYNLLKGTFDFTAEVIVWHHKFQIDSYPVNMPSLLHDYSEKTRQLIKYYGKIVAIADVYDALHRDNTRFGPNRFLDYDEIREQLLLSYPEDTVLIDSLYKSDTFAYNP